MNIRKSQQKTNKQNKTTQQKKNKIDILELKK